MAVVTIDEALDWIHSRLKFNIRPGLSRVSALLDLLDHPEQHLSMIHVAGTNGKGSTVAFVRSIFMKAGLKKVASYTSPFIETFGERMAINTQPMPDDKIIEYVNLLQPLVAQLDADEKLTGITEFEIITAMGFKYFYDEKVDLAVIEVGLGGLMDSTNVIQPEVCAITTIGLDHVDILGKTYEAIAAQKAGIIKEGIPVVSGNIGPEALAVIQKTAQEHHSQLFEFKKAYKIEVLKDECFNFTNDHLNLIRIEKSLLGFHQIENAAMAIEIADLYAQRVGIPLTEVAIREGLASAYWPARMEQIAESPLTLLDGAHNVHAMKRMLENLKKEQSGKKITILFSAITTKDIRHMIEMLNSVENGQLILTTFDHPKALSLNDFAEYAADGVQYVGDWRKEILDIRRKCQVDDIFLITGSLYFSSQVREFLLKNL
ncbi:bifunctional folylpolyglutamate synthase/dihydrofolate synthase [Lactococcus fujiensis]|uniref:tetrahydrofolate synthase n=1 Tax=Lactococcus fujiensis JCM 16395 TaxID=1291764 RepID=A0A2A5RJR7_9LACT|nr:folylpolyglutamate synthase/dihydrofolate synthase family protein [Lactococcus fujiensis]PCR99448.1 FolC protein [Lactococcus fujiensis JCM 16395]